MENHGFADLSNNPISNCFRSLCRQLLRSGSITGQNIEYKMENSPLVSGGKRLPSLRRTRQRLLCMSVLRFILCDGSYSFPDQPGFFPDEPRSKCFSLLLRGYSNDQISSTLFVSIPTVKKHLASIYSKMEIKSQKQILERLHFYDKYFSH